MIGNFRQYKERALDMRLRGYTYSEIKRGLGIEIPKSTLATWFKSTTLSKEHTDRINALSIQNLKAGQIQSQKRARERREFLFVELNRKNEHLKSLMTSKDIAKIALSVLYLGEGTKKTRGALVLGNSDPNIIRFFIDLLTSCYSTESSKFRATVQCRADQDIGELESYWSHVTGIPLGQFCKAQVDPRTSGKATKKDGYKGVCRITYYSAALFREIMLLPNILYGFKK